jgi:hypothetical protein
MNNFQQSISTFNESSHQSRKTKRDDIEPTYDASKSLETFTAPSEDSAFIIPEQHVSKKQKVETEQEIENKVKEQNQTEESESNDDEDGNLVTLAKIWTLSENTQQVRQIYESIQKLTFEQEDDDDFYSAKLEQNADKNRYENILPSKKKIFFFNSHFFSFS